MTAETCERGRAFAAKVSEVVVVGQFGARFDVLDGKNANSGFIRGRVHPPLRFAVWIATRIDKTSIIATKSSVDNLRRCDFHEVKVRFIFVFARQQTSRTFLVVDNFTHVFDDKVAREDVLL